MTFVPEFLKRMITSDYITLVKFVVPLALTDVIADIGEQVNINGDCQ